MKMEGIKQYSEFSSKEPAVHLKHKGGGSRKDVVGKPSKGKKGEIISLNKTGKEDMEVLSR